MTTAEYEPSPWEPIAEHVQRYLDTGGEDGAEWEGAQTIILTTTGRKTGKLRRTPLIRVHDDASGDYLVIASLGGAPSHPVWYLNLQANPDVTIQDRAEVHELRPARRRSRRRPTCGPSRWRRGPATTTIRSRPSETSRSSSASRAELGQPGRQPLQHLAHRGHVVDPMGGDRRV